MKKGSEQNGWIWKCNWLAEGSGTEWPVYKQPLWYRQVSMFSLLTSALLRLSRSSALICKLSLVLQDFLKEVWHIGGSTSTLLLQELAVWGVGRGIGRAASRKSRALSLDRAAQIFHCKLETSSHWAAHWFNAYPEHRLSRHPCRCVLAPFPITAPPESHAGPFYLPFPLTALEFSPCGSNM